jgi:hypothetical protein
MTMTLLRFFSWRASIKLLMDMQEKKVFVEVELASGYARAMWD